MRYRIFLALGLVWLLAVAGRLPLAAAEAASQPAVELSAQCTYGGTKATLGFSRLTDGEYFVPFTAPDGQLEITAPEGQTISWLYLCFAQLPERWEVRAFAQDAAYTVAAPSDGYAHVLVPVDGLARVQVWADGAPLVLNELRVFTAGALPPDVQDWQPTPPKADLLVLAAHPDDEFIYFGGLIPWYLHQGKTVVPAYMTCHDAVRRAELLNGLWTAGLRTYPVIGPFPDRFHTLMDKLYDEWTREEVDYFVMQLLRQYRPEVIVTHGRHGEYGHAAHKICADSALRMFDRAADPLYLPQLSLRYGAWQPQKLYLHLEDEGALVMDWKRDVGGQTALEIALDAFARHVSQQQHHVECGPGDRYDCSRFGLLRTAIGPDLSKNDLFENVPLGAN